MLALGNLATVFEEGFATATPTDLSHVCAGVFDRSIGDASVLVGLQQLKDHGRSRKPEHLLQTSW
jgi:hypothetical protein